MLKKLRHYFLSGLLVTLPLFLTIYILVVLFKFLDSIPGNLVDGYFQEKIGFYFPGMGLIIFSAFLLIVGFLSTHFFGKFFSNLLDKTIKKSGFLSPIYFSVKTILEFLFSRNQSIYKDVVLLEFPLKGCWAVGFVTNEGFKEANEKTGSELLNVYVPLAPNPITGFLVHMPRKDLIMLDISIKEAFQLIISGGVVNPPKARN